MGTVSGAQWTVGWIVAAAVVVIVVLVVGSIIYLAMKIRAQLAEILGALTAARDNTEPLWQLQATNEVAKDIVESARKLRASLGG